MVEGAPRVRIFPTFLPSIPALTYVDPEASTPTRTLSPPMTSLLEGSGTFLLNPSPGIAPLLVPFTSLQPWLRSH